jgi:VIT1/CCC1 family predicted Fe2+/Mn2+ transporter
MSVPQISPDHVKALEQIQRDEATEYRVYRYLESRVKNPHNVEVLEKMALEEQGHYQVCRRYTGKELPPHRLRMWFYMAISRLMGLTFGLKLMEKREGGAVEAYQALVGIIPEAEELTREEQQHELEIIDLLDEKGLKYVGSIVLGLNDALVEFTGSLAGFTFALQDTRVIAMAGVILGVAASLSMGASEYLSRKSESSEKNPFTAAFYTGIAYVITVIVMVLPYLLLENPYIALGLTLTIAVAIIVIFTFYVSIARDLPFWRRFGEMAAISLGIAAISFFIGVVVKTVLNVNI